MGAPCNTSKPHRRIQPFRRGMARDPLSYRRLALKRWLFAPISTRNEGERGPAGRAQWPTPLKLC